MSNTLNLLSESTFIEKMSRQNALLKAIAVQSGGAPEISSWAMVQQLVRLGVGAKVFSIGDQLVCNHSEYGKIVWDIIGIDHDTPVNTEFTHSLTLQAHYVNKDNLNIFDAPEPTNSNSGRKQFGSNTWSESNIRQWLNSNGEANAWFTPQTEYDVAPNYASKAGFLNGMDTDFLSVIGEVYKDTALNTVTDGGGVKRSEEKFFLLSMTEVYGGSNGSIEEGKAYAYYSDNSELSSPGTGLDAIRSKFVSGYSGGKSWWLRSPDTTFSNIVRFVGQTGGVVTEFPRSSMYIVPACCIV